MTPEKKLSVESYFASIRHMTSARIGIGRTGGSLTTAQILDFDLAHARAKDAVNSEFNALAFMNDLQMQLEAIDSGLSWMTLQSGAIDKPTFLKRPDYGRRLHPSSVEELNKVDRNDDLLIILSDGLSAQAVTAQSPGVLKTWLPLLISAKIKVGPILVIPHARVGIVDHIGEILKPKATLILLGERPGLATPESLGAYFTFKPHAGLTDADRNCISNIHSSGMEPHQAAHQLHFLLMESLRTSLGGVALSEFMGTHPDKPELE